MFSGSPPVNYATPSTAATYELAHSVPGTLTETVLSSIFPFGAFASNAKAWEGSAGGMRSDLVYFVPTHLKAFTVWKCAGGRRRGGDPNPTPFCEADVATYGVYLGEHGLYVPCAFDASR